MQTISACLIVRDEGRHLEACLQALQPFVHEICVLDTGSSDDSMAIAQGFGVRLGQFEWCDDFSAARNACLGLASGEWILSIDADELLDPESLAGLPELLADSTAQAYMVWIDNLDGGQDSQGRPSLHSLSVPRLFRNRPEIRFERPVHESVSASLRALHVDGLEPCGMRLVHHGYLPEAIVNGQKHERNARILEERLRLVPDDLFSAYKLALTQLVMGQTRAAREWLERTWSSACAMAQGPRSTLAFLPLVASNLIRECRRAGQLTHASEIAVLALQDYGQVSEVLFEAAEVDRACGRLEAAGRGYVAASACEPWTDLCEGQPATRGALPLCGLSRVAALAGDLELASSCIAKARLLDPQHIEARTIAARLATVTGREDSAWAELSKLLNECPGNAHVLMLAAEMAWSQAELETARGFWVGALALRESSSCASAWLLVFELVMGDFEAAARHGQQLVAADLPEAGALCILAGVQGEAPQLDPRIEESALRGELCAWLSELSRDPERRALSAFERGAPALEGHLGDLQGILKGYAPGA